MLSPVAFVPPNLVHYFEALSDDIPAELEPLYDYFEDNYLGRPADMDNAAHLILQLKCGQCTSEQSLDFHALIMLWKVGIEHSSILWVTLIQQFIN